MFSTLRHDLTLARRMLLKSPLFTGIAIVTLALGIGLNTAVFSAIDALLLRPLPGVREPGRLALLYRTWPGGMTTGSNSVPHFRDIQERSQDVFSGVAASAFSPVSMSSGGRSQMVMGQLVSANYFQVLGVGAARGRTFVAQEDSGVGAHPVVVLSHAFWSNAFGADPAIVGRQIIVNGAAYTVVGIAPRDFHGMLPIVTPAMWVPLVQVDQIRPDSKGTLERRGNNWMEMTGRLRPGISFAQARARLDAISARQTEALPDDYKGAGINLVPQSQAGIHPSMHSTQVALSSVVMAVVFMLLLIACVNVANLFLARARDRWREMAVRQSLGASRGILIRQLLVESTVFALIAGAVGIFIASGAISLLNKVQLPFDVDFAPDLRLSPLVLAFTLGIAVLTGVLFGLAPALQATRPSLVPTLKGEAPAGGARSRTSGVLVVAQMALSMILLACASMFVRNLRTAASVDKGFVSENVMLATVDPGLQGYDRARSTQFFRSLAERVRAIPGVTAVGMAADIPLGLGGSDNGVTIPGYTPQKDEGMSINYNSVAPGYFETMKIPLLRGRAFTEQDDSLAQSALVINERFAQRFWPGGDAIGKVVRARGRDHVVIGIVPTGKYKSLGEQPTAYMYYVQAQRWSSSMNLHIRTEGNPEAVVPALRSELAALDPSMPLANVRTMNNYLGTALLPARLIGGVLGVFGLLGLILAAVGMYGVMAYSVTQRTREIGIRMAIGAAQTQVLSLILRQGMTLVVVGSAVGLAGAVAASQLVRGLLIGGAAIDMVSFAVVPLVLIAVAMLAVWVPARRASSLNPVAALRTE